MSDLLRILHVFRAPIGGLFRHVLDAARGQAERGHAVGLFCDETTGGARAAEQLDALAPLLALGITRVPIRRQVHPGDAVALAALAHVCRAAKPDVLHGHGAKGGVLARLSPVSRPGAPVVRAYTPHGGTFNYKPGSLVHRIYMRAEAILARRTDVFLFESQYAKGRFLSHVGPPSGPAPVVHNGLAEAEFEPVRHRPDARDLLYVGELRSAKGIDTLLEAIALLDREARAVTLSMVGSGPDDALLRAHAERLGISGRLQFLGALPIRAALETGRVIVIPSRAESLPYVILEAAAAAQPMIATDVGGIPEIFGPQSGELIPPGDPAGLARTIAAKLDETPEERTVKAERLRRYVRSDFRIDRMVDGGLAGYRHGLRHATRTRN